MEKINLPFLENIDIFTFKIFPSFEEKKIKIALIKYCQNLAAKKIIPFSFTGLVRFDLIPDQKGMPRGIYEINAHSPECVAAAAWLGQRKIGNADKAFSRFVSVLKREFGQRKIILIPGDCPVKNTFLPYLVKRLIKEGIKIKVVYPCEAMEKDFPPSAVIWRWGDLRMKGENQYPPKFAAWLERQESRGVKIFNSLLPEADDFSSKEKILYWEKGKKLSSPEDLIWAKETAKEKNLVLKPLAGASGKGIYFSRFFKQSQWEQLLAEVLNSKSGEYGVFLEKLLPSKTIAGEKIVFDLNPAFWVSRGRLRFLYVIIRIEKEDIYRKTLKINVAQGGGIAANFLV